ncbi:two-component system, OmpR family, sensor histidine kinase TctE [Litoreibacter ascidiaceicola]|uniref:histidine kinase n=1 Tax=Litoreibacter ascidiaceicola TaxID=1486859 RepID=A0A1M4Z4K1_9RHOB|nr:sensor histidine kinase [Litoreibacter ascidiaceicola]SHF13013.1 two-component system, OmpR family, sensor histidine kinase TctE [Litoreibacter ascidiaceicola]
MKQPTSIRKRLFYQLAAVAAVLSLAFVLVVRGVASQAAEGTQDDILAASATAIADSLTSEDGEVTLELPYSALSMLGTINEDRVFYRVMVQGETLTGYTDLPVTRSPRRLDTPTFSTEMYRGDEVRVASVLRRVANTATGSEVVVSVAQTRSGLAAISRSITITATGVGLLFFLLATTLSLLAANSALRPLRRMTGAVTRRGPSDLRPVTAEAPKELVPLVDALNSFMGRLRASLSRTEDLISEAAHRVRTPLATVRTQAEVTHRKLNKPEHKKAIRDMIRAIDESSRSAGQILDHAMVTFRADSLALDPLDLIALINETCDRLAPTADLKDIALLRELPDSSVPFNGDGIMLQAALHNILDNAIKYSPEDSDIAVRIASGAELRVSIADQGRGFGGMDLKDLTTRYSRGTNVGDVVGSGLGLTIADEVARAHGGRLELSQSKEGQGACVSLILPYV